MLKIMKAKPNPLGKDRVRALIPPQQLAGEWVDIKNEGNSPVNLNGFIVCHIAYTGNGCETQPVKEFVDFILPAGKIFRLHSGGYMPESQLSLPDSMEADYHEFTGKNYVWNNDKPDRPSILNLKTKQFEDQADYDAYPPEGKILIRSGNKLL